MKKFVPRFRPFAVPADKVAAVVEKALTARKPRARYVVGFGPRLQALGLTSLPSRRATGCYGYWAVSRNEFVGPFVKRSPWASPGSLTWEAAALQWLSAADGNVPCAKVLGRFQLVLA
jgi:hypothetical protein